MPLTTSGVLRRVESVKSNLSWLKGDLWPHHLYYLLLSADRFYVSWICNHIGILVLHVVCVSSGAVFAPEAQTGLSVILQIQDPCTNPTTAISIVTQKVGTSTRFTLRCTFKLETDNFLLFRIIAVQAKIKLVDLKECRHANWCFSATEKVIIKEKEEKADKQLLFVFPFRSVPTCFQMNGWLWRAGLGACHWHVCPAPVPEVLWAFLPLPTWQTGQGISSWCGILTHWDSSSTSTGTLVHRTRWVHIYYTFTLEHHLMHYFFPIFQFDLPFVEVHRVTAVRFSLPSSKEEGEYEEIGEPSSTISEAEIGCVESEGRNGSQTCLTEKSAGRIMTDKQKTPDSFLCGLCCATPPPVSVWNCDGEILPVTEVFCRWVHRNNS